MPDAIDLVFRGTPGDSAAISGGFTTTLDVSGPPILTRQLSGSNPLLALQSYRVMGSGHRTIDASDPGCLVNIMYDQAHVEGIFGSKAFDFDVTPTPPPNMKDDKLTEIAWGLAMAGRHYVLGAKGEYRPAKADIDAHGEAFALLIDAPVRLPPNPVEVGAEWTTDWPGACAHKETGARFQFQQICKLLELTEGDTRALIAFKTTGTLTFPNKPSPQREESLLETKGTMLLDLTRGLFTMVETAGMITTELKQAGVKLVRGTSSRYELV